MFYKSKLLRDTAILTIFQLILDSAALLLNAFITRQLGAQAIGILSLIGSFLVLACILSNGNAFLCTSRLIAEENGKGGDPNKVLFHGIKLCLCLSTAVSAAVLLLSEPICRRFFSGADMSAALRIMPVVLVTGAVGACIKGYFNASRRTRVTAVGDVIEFAVKSAVIAVLTIKLKSPDEASVCRVMISGIVAGNGVSLGFLSAMYLKFRSRAVSKPSIGFREYAACAFPIMGGGVLTAVLSSTNDALIPFCLRQYGDSAGKALGSFGVFEAIVIPALFFPSVILCSVSGIILSESARAAASGDKRRIKSLASRVTEYTLIYAVFSSAVLMRFGDRRISRRRRRSRQAYNGDSTCCAVHLHGDSSRSNDKRHGPAKLLVAELSCRVRCQDSGSADIRAEVRALRHCSVILHKQCLWQLLTVHKAYPHIGYGIPAFPQYSSACSLRIPQHGSDRTSHENV